MGTIRGAPTGFNPVRFREVVATSAKAAEQAVQDGKFQSRALSGSGCNNLGDCVLDAVLRMSFNPVRFREVVATLAFANSCCVMVCRALLPEPRGF
jgi:hypothetical protein